MYAAKPSAHLSGGMTSMSRSSSPLQGRGTPLALLSSSSPHDGSARSFHLTRPNASPVCQIRTSSENLSPTFRRRPHGS